jgi:hypothetical protein
VGLSVEGLSVDVALTGQAGDVAVVSAEDGEGAGKSLQER